jgi:hypothetical protein
MPGHKHRKRGGTAARTAPACVYWLEDLIDGGAPFVYEPPAGEDGVPPEPRCRRCGRPVGDHDRAPDDGDYSD